MTGRPRRTRARWSARAKEVATREDAEALRGLDLYMPRDALPAPDEDEFYFADLIGLAAVSPDGEALGPIKCVQNFGAGDLLEIAPPDGPDLVAAVHPAKPCRRCGSPRAWWSPCGRSK